MDKWMDDSLMAGWMGEWMDYRLMTDGLWADGWMDGWMDYRIVD